MNASEQQVASTTGTMVGTAARPTLLGSRTQLKIFAAQGLPENFKYLWLDA
jgi:hypothetical protein